MRFLLIECDKFTKKNLMKLSHRKVFMKKNVIDGNKIFFR